MRILVSGAAGMLGTDVCRAATEAGLEVLGYNHTRLDVADRAAVETAMRRAMPDLVINCAAWTDVDGAEESPDDALNVNGAGAGNVARAAAECGAWTVHVSTDYVFDGSKTVPYVGRNRRRLGGSRSTHDRSQLVVVRLDRQVLSEDDPTIGG
jgi:dTDP-4-dehydrorhamnose reductase